jgi:hypothetical protein
MLFRAFGNFDDDYNETPKYVEYRLVNGIKVDRRSCSKPEEIRAYRGEKDWWYSEGKNHRVVNGQIERDFYETFCVIELNTLEELLDFQDKYGVNASVSNKSGYIYEGKELPMFHEDFYMD